jgi:hypothetical protein
VRTALVICALLSVLAAPLGAQSRIRTDVDTLVVTVGDRITMTISVDHAVSAQARLPDSLALEPFEVLEVRALPVTTSEDGARSAWTVTMVAFELGELEIPPVPVEVAAADGPIEMLETDRYGVEIVSVGVDEAGGIRDIRGPLGIPVGVWTALLWVLGPLLIAALLYALVRRLMPAREEVVRPALGDLRRPAHEVALEALAALEASSLLDDGQVKEYHIAASDILRTYVEERFRVEALEMTTREVLEGLSNTTAGASFCMGLRTFLEACDLVKFAKVRPEQVTSQAALELGRTIIVESVSPPPVPDEPVAVAAGDAS